MEGWSCSRRVKALMRREGRVSEDPVVEALERCCLAVSHGTGRSTSVNRPPPPPIDFTSPNARSHFPESWMYQDEDILITGLVLNTYNNILQDYILIYYKLHHV